MPVLLAHQGGWDEMLMVAAPILAIVLLLRLAKRRVAARQATEQAGRTGQSSAADRSTSAPNDANRPTRSS
ncbi:MAG: hypothetical protein QM733_12865 [Ilumatobacteraceae bacterium]